MGTAIDKPLEPANPLGKGEAVSTGGVGGGDGGRGPGRGGRDSRGGHRRGGRPRGKRGSKKKKREEEKKEGEREREAGGSLIRGGILKIPGLRGRGVGGILSQKQMRGLLALGLEPEEEEEEQGKKREEEDENEDDTEEEGEVQDSPILNMEKQQHLQPI
ncbi:hypothetical protein TrVFT333_003121 [Trichoderma virens FT-333]|nr:hypothetical protein TrVFT333_003121 [Trichoderma virens FT-333]